MDEHLMKIGELALFFNISKKALRLYEKKGLLKPAKTDPLTGYRYYSADQVQQLNALIELKALGFSLDEIKTILNGGTSADRLTQALADKKRAWQEQIQLAENKIDAIESITARLNMSGEAPDIQSMTEEQRAFLLVKMVCVEDLRGQSILSEALWL